MNLDFYKGRRVLVTGHTGFKGVWLATWLEALGAKVTGLSLPPGEEMLEGWPSLTERYPGEGDVRDLATVQTACSQSRPEVIFHLAAQALVRPSYADPLGTFATNVLGTANVLEVARRTPSVRVVVVVTTDKVYANREWHWGYREEDPLGGHDPYSASKACAELVTSAYRTSYGQQAGSTRIASARAGNVIGGGDWAEARIVPDIVRGIVGGQVIHIRRPGAIRPWQHVLECLSGYLMLGAAVADDERYARAWNFGPFEMEPMSVGELAQRFVQAWGEGELCIEPAVTGPHEARFLKLDPALALAELGWRPLLSPEERLSWTVDWYRGWRAHPGSVWGWTLKQIEHYTARMASGLAVSSPVGLRAA